MKFSQAKLIKGFKVDKRLRQKRWGVYPRVVLPLITDLCLSSGVCEGGGGVGRVLCQAATLKSSCCKKPGPCAHQQLIYPQKDAPHIHDKGCRERKKNGRRRFSVCVFVVGGIATAQNLTKQSRQPLLTPTPTHSSGHPSRKLS